MAKSNQAYVTYDTVDKITTPDFHKVILDRILVLCAAAYKMRFKHVKEGHAMYLRVYGKTTAVDKYNDVKVIYEYDDQQELVGVTFQHHVNDTGY